MLEPLLLDTRDEFFIALGMTDIHSFVMLGVVKDGSPQLLARVAKTTLNLK